jgi:hypothetical protein
VDHSIGEDSANYVYRGYNKAITRRVLTALDSIPIKKTLTMQIKNFALFSISVLTVLSLLTTSCKKSSNDSSAGLSATFRDTTFGASQTVAVYFKDYQYWDIAGYTIKGGDSVGIEIEINAPVTLNSPITTNNGTYIDYYLNGNDYAAAVGTGNTAMMVTSLDTVNHKISGTFSGMLYNMGNGNDSSQMTNGKFNTTYIVQ